MTEAQKRALRREYVGSWIRDMRSAAHLTQRDVADALGYTTAQFVSNWERGLRDLSLVLEDLADRDIFYVADQLRALAERQGRDSFWGDGSLEAERARRRR